MQSPQESDLQTSQPLELHLLRLPELALDLLVHVAAWGHQVKLCSGWPHASPELNPLPQPGRQGVMTKHVATTKRPDSSSFCTNHS